MKEITHQDYIEYSKSNKIIELFEKEFELSRPPIKSLNPEKFKLETTSIFSFPKRGEWATHYLNAGYRGNFAPEIPRNMILRYSREGDTVLDPMCGSGTTLIECKLLKRIGLGIDINPKAIMLTRNRLDFEVRHKQNIRTFIGDCREMTGIRNESIDLIVTHPPYANIIEYDSGNEKCLSGLTIKKFLEEMEIIAKEFYRVLKPDSYCAILIGDTRKQKHQIPLAYQVMTKFLKNGFKLKEDIIKAQWNCAGTRRWENASLKQNFYLIMHEHLFVFRRV